MLVKTDDEALTVLLQNMATRKEGFRLVLLKYQQLIYNFLRRMGFSHEEADEQIQEIFIEFWRTLSLLQKTEASYILLYRLAADVGLKRLSEKPEGEVKVFPEQRRVFTVVSEQHGMQPALSKLTGSQKIIFILKQYEQFGYSDIASITRMPVVEVRNHFNEALDRFSISYQQP